MHEPMAWLQQRRNGHDVNHPALVDGLTRPNLTRYERHYVTGLAWIDASVGRLLGALERLQIATQTLTIFTADHGRDGKYTCTAAGMRVPWIAHWPGAVGAGAFLPDHALVSHIDLLPTILDAVGAPPPQEKEGEGDGQSLMPLVLVRQRNNMSPRRHEQHQQQVETRWQRRHVRCETYRDRAIVSRTHHLVRRFTGGSTAAAKRPGVPRDGRDGWTPSSWRDHWQLYNHSSGGGGGDEDADPNERRNLLAGREARQVERLARADPAVAPLWRELLRLQ